MDRLISEQAVLKAVSKGCFELRGVYARCEEGIKAITNSIPLDDVFDKIKDEIENHCGLIKENHCKYCSYCNSVMGVREILEIIDKYKQKGANEYGSI